MFPGELHSNRVSQDHAEFAPQKIAGLIQRGSLVPYAEVKRWGAPTPPHLSHAIGVEPSKPRLIYDARSLNKFFEHVPFKLDTVGSFGHGVARVLPGFAGRKKRFSSHAVTPGLVDPIWGSLGRGGLRVDRLAVRVEQEPVRLPRRERGESVIFAGAGDAHYSLHG